VGQFGGQFVCLLAGGKASEKPGAKKFFFVKVFVLKVL
jgi:hypothetical protein